MKPQIVMSKLNNAANNAANNFSAKYRVYYEDTDAGGVVYYANYLKFFERARTDFLRNLGISQSQLIEQEKLAFIVKNCEIEYRKPAKLDDLIDVNVTVQQVGGASITMLQEIFRGEEILSQLKIVIVSVDVENFKPRKLPVDIADLLRSV